MKKTEIFRGNAGVIYRLGKIPPAMFEFFLHKRREYKDGTAQWNVGVSPTEDPDKGFVFIRLRGTEEDAQKNLEAIIKHYQKCDNE